MTIHDCHCPYHFGDCVIALRLIHHLAQRHPERVWRMAVHSCHLPELQPLVDHQPNITLCAIETFGIQPRSIDLWKNANEFWSTHPLKNDFAAFTKRYFRRLIRKFGLNDPTPGLLFDFPCLEIPPENERRYTLDLLRFQDVFFVNSNPQSAQFLDYREEDSLNEMARALRVRNNVLTTKKVDDMPCTRDFNLTCAEIGFISNTIPVHVMVSTGPSWLTFHSNFPKNIWIPMKRRILMIGNGERVDLTGDTVNCKTIAQAMDELKRVGLI